MDYRSDVDLVGSLSKMSPFQFFCLKRQLKTFVGTFSSVQTDNQTRELCDLPLIKEANSPAPGGESKLFFRKLSIPLPEAF